MPEPKRISRRNAALIAARPNSVGSRAERRNTRRLSPFSPVWEASWYQSSHPRGGGPIEAPHDDPSRSVGSWI
jgi:hypothetical protein